MYALVLDLNSGTSSKRPISLIHYQPDQIDTSQDNVIEKSGDGPSVDPLPWEERFYDTDNDNIFVEKVREPQEDDVELNLATDKSEITADGTDTATITASVTPVELGNHADAYFRVEGDTQASSAIDSNGEAMFELASETTGTFQLAVDIGGLVVKRLYVEAV